MNKIKKIRIIILFVAIGLVIANVALSIFSGNINREYGGEVYDALVAAGNNEPDVPKAGTSSGIIGVFIVAGLSVFFFIFAFIYIFNTKNAKTYSRKWPYITMITFGAIGILLKLTTYLMTYSKSQPTALKDAIDTEANRLIIEHIWLKYQTRLTTYIFIEMFVSAVVIALHTWQLFLIRSNQNQSDIQYSNQVIRAAEAVKSQPQNDLP